MLDLGVRDLCKIGDYFELLFRDLGVFGLARKGLDDAEEIAPLEGVVVVIGAGELEGIDDLHVVLLK